MAMRIYLSVSQAEDLLATIWIALEKHGLTSPNVRILSRGTKLKLELIFGSGRDENLVTAELPRAMVRKILPRAFVRKIERASAMVALEPDLYATTLGYLAG
jgi:hypothetical protein